LVINGLM